MEYSTENITVDVVKFVAEFQDSDYAQELKQKIKSYAQKAKLPGFRKGKLPQMMIKKIKPRFFQEVIVEKVDELFKEYQKSINRKPLLGPIVSNGDIKYPENDSVRHVKTELIVYFQPQFELNLEILKNLVKTKEIVTSQRLDREINQVRTKHRQFLPNEKDQKADEKYYSFLVIGKNGKKLPKPLKFSSKFLKDSKQLEIVNQYQVGDKFMLAIKKILGDDFKDWNESYNNQLTESQEVELSEIDLIVYPEFNHHLVKKEFPYMDDLTDENYKDLFKEELQKRLSKSDDHRFYREIIDYLIEQKLFSLDEKQILKFLNIQEEIKKPYTQEQLQQIQERECKKYAEQIIEEQIFDQEKLKIDQEVQKNAYYQSLYQVSLLQGFDFFRLNANSQQAAENWIEYNRDEIQYRTNKFVLETTIFNHLSEKFQFKEKEQKAS
ncbi:MAG: trigger factor family protein [Flavobacteriaceae bacterium]|nr:trigger factor family protein [Flavobacteriaceae bacterium]